MQANSRYEDITELVNDTTFIKINLQDSTTSCVTVGKDLSWSISHELINGNYNGQIFYSDITLERRKHAKENHSKEKLYYRNY